MTLLRNFSENIMNRNTQNELPKMSQSLLVPLSSVDDKREFCMAAMLRFCIQFKIAVYVCSMFTVYLTFSCCV